MFGIVSMNSLKISEMPPRSWESDGCLIYTLPKIFTYLIISVNNTLILLKLIFIAIDIIIGVKSLYKFLTF